MLEVKDWTVHHPLYPEKIVDNKINCKVHKGEVVGFSGLQGAGRTEFAMSVFGKSYGSNISGELYIKGRKSKSQESARCDSVMVLTYVTEDRKTNGLILGDPFDLIQHLPDFPKSVRKVSSIQIWKFIWQMR